MLPIIISTGVGYLLGMPLLLRLICFAQKKLIVDRAVMKAGNRRAAQKNLPKPIWPTVKERLAFAFKDNRPVKLPRKETGGISQNRIFFILLWALGLAAFVLAPVTGRWALLALGLLAFILSVSFGLVTSKSVIETRKNVIQRMYNIGKAKLGLSAEYNDNPGAAVRVLEWRDLIKPQQVEYDVPDTFGEEGAEGFLRQFNQVFGGETTWVPSDDPETGTPGWNFEEGKVTLRAVPPLPRKADWSAHYVLDSSVAWSFFPIALGVENGLELTNPETGATENVLGFDLSGEQRKLSKKTGAKLSGNIATSPHVFVGGGTGGGKSLSIDTPVRVLRKASETVAPDQSTVMN